MALSGPTMIRETGGMRAKLASLGVATSEERAAQWVMKALHPADGTIGAPQMPDGCPGYTVPVETTVVASINPGATVTTAWGANLTLVPHPTCLMAVDFTDGASAIVPYTIRNTMFLGANTDSDIRVLMSQAEEWRLTAMSATVHLDATATTDSGTVVAAQYPVKPIPLMTLACGFNNMTPVWHEPAIFHETNDQPSYNSLMMLPQAYHTNAKEGCYLPLKLSQTSQHWRSARENCSLCNIGQLTQQAVNVGGWTMQPGIGGTPAFPNWDLTQFRLTAAYGVPSGAIQSAYLGDNFGRMAFKNLNPTAALVVKIRCCLELRVNPLSPQVTHLKPACPLDPAALAEYFRISVKLDDAYPASFNDGGKILGRIAQALRLVGPYLGVIPAVGPALSAAAAPLSQLAEFGARAMASPFKVSPQPGMSKELALDPRTSLNFPRPAKTVTVRKRKRPVSARPKQTAK